MSEMDFEPISPLNPLAAQLYVEKAARKKERTVCSCGHSMNYHETVAGVTACTPARIACKCKMERPVIRTDNLRLFLKNTTGVGIDHALGKGLVACVAGGVNFEWVESPARCDICMEEMLEPIPVAVNVATGMPTDVSTGVDKIVCIGCYMNWITGVQ